MAAFNRPDHGLYPGHPRLQSPSTNRISSWNGNMQGCLRTPEHLPVTESIMARLKLKMLNPLGLADLITGGFSHSAKPPAMPPGALVHVGEQLTDKVTFRIVEYNKEKVVIEDTDDIAECLRFKDTRPVTWFQVTGLHEIDKISELGKRFEIHPLVLEDILNTSSRPKVEMFDDYLFVISKLLRFDQETRNVEMQQFALIVFKTVVITFLEAPTTVFDPVLERINKGAGRIRGAEQDYLAWALMDAVVDHYFGVIDGVDHQLSDLDGALQEDAAGVEAGVLFAAKREVAELHRLVRPIREIATALHRGDSLLLTDYSKPFFRDLYDHAIQAIESVEDLRELASGLRDFYLSAVSNRMNEIMKVLTLFASFFLPLTFLAGIYGMNFEHMPELAVPWAYPALWSVFIVASIGMFILFKRKKWL